MQPGSRLLGNGSGDEFAPWHESGPAPIAARDSDATEIELPPPRPLEPAVDLRSNAEDGRVRNGASDWQIADQFIVRLRTGQIRPGDRTTVCWPIGG